MAGVCRSSYLIQMVPYIFELALLAGIGHSARMPAISISFTRHLITRHLRQSQLARFGRANPAVITWAIVRAGTGYSEMASSQGPRRQLRRPHRPPQRLKNSGSPPPIGASCAENTLSNFSVQQIEATLLQKPGGAHAEEIEESSLSIGA